MRIDLYTLQLFVAVVEEGSIAAASQREHIAASALSKRVGELERSVGVPLLSRLARGVEPTVAGRVLATRARTLLHNAADLQAEMRDFSEGVRGQVRVMATVSVILQFLPAELKAFGKRHPNIQVDLEENISGVITRSISENIADIGIYSQADDDHGLVTYPYHHDRLALVVPFDHPLAQRSSVSFAETLDYDYVGMHKGSSLNLMLTRAASAAGGSLHIRYQVTGFDAVIAMVRAGLGVGILPAGAAELIYSPADIRVLALDDTWAVRHSKLCVRTTEGLSTAARLLLEHLRAPGGGPDRQASR